MPELTSTFVGISSPNPFWLASGPPTNTAGQVHRAFEAGWGGAVWKTIGAPAQNVSNRYGALNINGQRMVGLNNLELISDRSVEVNLREIAEVKRRWPDRAVVVSAMVESTPDAWKEIVRRIEDSGADGIELNYGCPHGMSERGMGSAVGQVPEYCAQITEWVSSVSKLPVIAKLTPNVADIVPPGRAAVQGGAAGLALINTINSIIGVDLKSLRPSPDVAGRGGHGGYAGPAVKPIALHMVSALASDPELYGTPISAMGGISTWQDAAEFILLGASNLQLCSAIMHHGFRIIDELCDGLSRWLDEHEFASVSAAVGRSLPTLTEFQDLDLSYRTVARIDPEACIQCNLCYIACEDGAHQCIDLKQPGKNGRPLPVVREDDCVGCRLCNNVCPVAGCITMEEAPRQFEPITWRQLTNEQPEVATNWEALERFRTEKGIRIQ